MNFHQSNVLFTTTVLISGNFCSPLWIKRSSGILKVFMVWKIIEFCKQLNLQCISEAFYYRLQREVLFKIIWMVWCYEQVRKKLFFEFCVMLLCLACCHTGSQRFAVGRTQAGTCWRWQIWQPWLELNNLSIYVTLLSSFMILGYSAQFCTYSIQSLKTKKVLSLWVAEKSMVGT